MRTRLTLASLGLLGLLGFSPSASAEPVEPVESVVVRGIPTAAARGHLPSSPLFERPGNSAAVVLLAQDKVVLDGETWRALHDAANPPPPKPEGPRAATREVTITPTPDASPPGFAVEAQWELQADRPGYFAGLVAGADLVVDTATLDGKPAQIMSTPAGGMLVAWVDGAATLRVTGTQAVTEGDPLTLTLMPAVRGRIDVDHPTFVPSIVRGTDAGAPSSAVVVRKAVWSGAGQLALRIGEPTPAVSEDGPTAIAHVGTGLTVGEGEVRGHARVVVEVRRGELPALTLRVAGVGDDLEIDGRDVTRWNRSGERLAVELGAPLQGRTELDLTWSTAVARGDETTVPVPRIEVEQVFRADASLQLARDGELEVLPVVSAWTAISRDELPRYGQGLVEGTPTAAYRRSATTGDAGSLRLLRFVPVPGPAVVVDVAAYSIATSAEGRVLARAHYEVRNERAANLRVSPPPGLEIIGARVAGETALPARTADGTWLIPLKRSLETVQGLLSFPVEVTLLGEVDAWERREKRSLSLPVVDAPVAVSRVTLHLPPEYESKLDPGDGTIVDDFTEGEGITYGLGFGEVGIAQADAQFQAAVQDYLDNDFDAAQRRLDELRSMGAGNENIERLQANVDLVTGKAGNGAPASTPTNLPTSGEDMHAQDMHAQDMHAQDMDAQDMDGQDTGVVIEGDELGRQGLNADKPAKPKDGRDAALARRIKSQARARAQAEFEEQRKLEQEAESAYRAGDYEQAEQRYSQAIDLGERLENLEQEESVEQSRRNVALEEKLASVRSTKEQRSAQQDKGKKKRKVPAWFSKRAEKKAAKRIAKAERSSVSVYDFEDDNVDGEILSPQGANIASRSRVRARGSVTYGGSDGGDEVKEPDAAIPEEESESEGEEITLDGAKDRAPAKSAPPPPEVYPTPEPEPMPVPDAPAPQTTVTADDSPDLGSEMILEEAEDRDFAVAMESSAGVTVAKRRRGGRLRAVGRSIGGVFKRSRKVKTKNTTRPKPRRRSRRGGGDATAAPPQAPAEDPADSRLESRRRADREEPPPPPPAAPAGAAGDDDWAMADSIRDPTVTDEAALGPVIEELPAPEATASALSVIIPAVGDAVRYQQLLIEAGAAQTISIDARRPLRRRRSSRR